MKLVGNRIAFFKRGDLLIFKEKTTTLRTTCIAS